MRGLPWSFCLWLSVMLAADPAAGSADLLSVTRRFDQRVALINSGILITATLTNGSAAELRGFYFTDQLPSTFTVKTLGIEVGGRMINNFTVETGCDGDVFPGYTPWRWRIETPSFFMESNAIPPRATVQIRYAVSSSASGIFALQPFDWAAFFVDPTNSVFGLALTVEEGTVRFVESTNLPLLTMQTSPAGPAVWVDGAPYTPYVLSCSFDLVRWVPLTTNKSPFAFVETNSAPLTRRFYRAEPLPSP